MKLSPNEHKALMAYENLISEWVHPFKNIITNADGLDQLNVRRAVRGLARKGLLKLATGFSEKYGLIAGRGYMITLEGEVELKHRLDVTKTRRLDTHTINLTPVSKETKKPVC